MSIKSMFEKERYFAINKNSSINEYPSVQEALNSLSVDYVVIDTFRCEYKAPLSHSWRLSNFRLLNCEGKEIKININNWEIKEIVQLVRLGDYYEFSLAITDPLNVLKVITKKIKEKRVYADWNSHDISIVLESEKSLFRYSKFLNWTQYDLEMENEKLRKTNKDLKDKIRRLSIK